MPDFRNSPLFTPRRSPYRSPRIKCASCLKWHADVKCHHDVGEIQLQDGPQDVTAALVSTIDRLSRIARTWETRAKEAVEYARQVSIDDRRDLSRQLTEALARNSELESQLKASQLLATNLESELRSARQRVTDQDNVICILREQCNAASASSATLAMQLDVNKSELLQAQVSLDSSRSRVSSLEEEVKSLKPSLEAEKAKLAEALTVSSQRLIDLNDARTTIKSSRTTIQSLEQQVAKLKSDVKSLDSDLDDWIDVCKARKTKIEDASFFLQIVESLAEDRCSSFMEVVRNIRTCFRERGSDCLGPFYIKLRDRHPVSEEDIDVASTTIQSLTRQYFESRSMYMLT